jgi:hypothetical protein
MGRRPFHVCAKISLQPGIAPAAKSPASVIPVAPRLLFLHLTRVARAMVLAQTGFCHG